MRPLTALRGSKPWLGLLLAGFVLVPLVLLLLPADYFDQGQSISLFALLGTEEFYSKGLTKASMHLIHLDLDSAIAYNPLSLVVVPILAGLWALGAWRTWKRLKGMDSNQDSTQPASPRQGYAWPLAIPLLGLVLFLVYYLIPETGLSFFWAMPLVVALSALATVVARKAYAYPGRTQWMIAGGFASAILVLGLTMIRFC